MGRITAVALQRMGCAVTLFSGTERRPDSARPRALFLWTSALRALAACDRGRSGPNLAQRIEACGVRIERMDIHAWSGARLSSLPIGALGRGLDQPTIVVEPEDLQATLMPLFTGTTIDRDVLAGEIKPETWSRFHVHDHGPFDLVLIATGRESPFRALIQDEPATKRPAFQDAFVGVCSSSDMAPSRRLPSGTSLTILGSRLRIWLTPVKRGIAWYACVKREPGSQGPRVWDLAGLRRLFDTNHPLVCEVLQATDPQDIGRIAISDVPPTRPWVRGGLALLGDAAHAPTPDLGFGACLGIEGAMTLVQSLERAAAAAISSGEPPDWAAALRQYEARHFPRAQRLVELSRAAALLSMPESRMADSLRDLVTAHLFGGMATDDLRHILAYEAYEARPA